MVVAIIETGTANVASVVAALHRLGADAVVTTDAAAVGRAEHVVLPGVGSFESGMRALAAAGLEDVLRERIAADLPTLAICLGMQLLLEASAESPGVAGLGIVPGRAERLTGDVPVPQLGWNRVQPAPGFPQAAGYAYFAHSFALRERPAGHTPAWIDYGGPVVAAFARGRLLACQFHPELSGTWGAALLRGWLDAAAAVATEPPVRVIPCLDVRDGRVVKGINFQGLRDAGDPVERAAAYEAQGADELVVLDVSATPEGRRTAVATVAAVRACLSIPLTVGGGVRSVEDARRLLAAGADKVGVNTAAVERPELLSELAASFGTQCTVLSLDAARAGDGWDVRVRSGAESTGRDAVSWAREAVARGAGEILLTSFDRDGTRSGYDLALLSAVTSAVDVPVIASGGASEPSHLVDAARCGATGLLAASIFHDGDRTVHEVKESIHEAGIEVRA